MSILPPNFVISSTLKIGVIYKFSAPELITTSVPHYFIVVARESDDNYLVLCTTQIEQKEEYFANNGLDYNTLIYIKPQSDNGLTSNTYINCNDYYTISTSTLIEKVKSNTFSISGNISLEHYDQIREGIIKSYTNDLPASLLIHPDE